ncbi:Helix-turn-helix domain-containing protein [Cnuella takakiae]|uniref:Helix-turn-helix domain-containing protein n=1 Tax=Cnuella takakiae TaxID=1302690 RepID=A0A1M4TLP7_9BACT|nr:helix-turn-helix transcriptional regulator [Cnuella takakiae]OLY90759.1 AraC family transcriptional regulator [Cnuella takakiae]SHE45358.1 Helix-turn-helix domain-containing protein [Cnuella takakiae]
MTNIQTITQFHRLTSLPEPLHPLVSVARSEDCRYAADGTWDQFITQFYCIALKHDVKGKIRYGQQLYDYDKGVLSFTAPRQVQSLDLSNLECGAGLLLFFHPDLLLKHPLAKTITQYGFFSYAVNEALHLSAAEEGDIVALINKIAQECRHIDRHTQDILVSQIDLLLAYANRFYERQFLTRKASQSDLLTRFEAIVDAYFTKGEAEEKSLLSVQQVAAALHLSPNYLGDMLRTLTGQNAQQHIHEKLIQHAKEKLSTTSLSVAEVAYALGFEHAQSFSKLFKNKTAQSPLEFRQSFN